MKRITLLVLFFYCCTFASPPQTRAAVPLALIAAAAVGAAMVSTSAGTYYAQEGEMPQYVKTASSAVASAADAVFQPSYLAQAVGYLFTPQSLNTAKQFYAAKAAAVGASIGNLIDLVNNSASDLYADLRSVFSTNSSTTLGAFANDFTWPVGAIVTTPSGNVKVNGSWGWVGYYQNETRFSSLYQSWFATQSVYSVATSKISWYGNYLYRWTPGYVTTSGYGMLEKCSAPSTADAATEDAPASTIYDFPAIAGSLGSPSGGIATDLKDAIKALPDTKKIITDAVPDTSTDTSAPPSLTAAEVAQLLKDNAAAVAQAAAAAAQDVVNSGATDAAAQIAALQTAVTAAQAVAQVAIDTAEKSAAKETFSPISASPFGAAYNPGAYDIPTRFTLFLSNVKSSGLFSFSSAFFDSLPGGGSPLLTIDGGQTFGTHTYDFSQAFSSGLPILKAVLLALFGFLSIRAIIMKR